MGRAVGAGAAGELFHQTADTVGGKDSTGFNLGAIYDFDEHNHLLVSAGAGIQNARATNLYSWYLGYQITGPEPRTATRSAPTIAAISSSVRSLYFH